MFAETECVISFFLHLVEVTQPDIGQLIQRYIIHRLYSDSRALSKVRQGEEIPDTRDGKIRYKAVV